MMPSFRSVTSITIAMTVIAAFAAPASAQDRVMNESQCTNPDAESRNKKIGAAIGGIGGAFLGRKIADDNKTVGTLLGAAGGAIVGSAIAKSLTQCDKELIDSATQSAAETGGSVAWANSQSGHSGTITASPAVQMATSQDNQLCRTIETSTQTSDSSEQQTLTMCRNADGTWEKV